MTRVQHRLLSSMRVAVFLLLLLSFVTLAQGTTTTPEPTTTPQGTTQPETTQPETTQPGTTQPGTTQPGTTQPGTTQPTPADSVTDSTSTTPGESVTESSTDSTTMSSSSSPMETSTASPGETGGTTESMNETATTLPPTPAPSTGDNSSSTPSPSSEVTSPEVNATTEASNDTTSSTNATDSSSTPAPTTPAPTTPAPTTPTPTTTEQTPYPSQSVNLDTAMHMLQLVIGDSTKITSTCNVSATTTEVDQAFQTVSGFLFVTSTSPGSSMAITIYFRSQILLMNSAMTQNETEGALMALNSYSCVNVTPEYAAETSLAFAQSAMDPCQAEKVCQVGYRCEASQGMATCKHLCRDFDCGHGYCSLNLTGPMEVTQVCSCLEEGMYVYTGEKCHTAVHRPDVVIAIVAGVLGSLCFILLLILICVCIQRARDNAHKYEMNGHFNEGYTGHSLSKM